VLLGEIDVEETGLGMHMLAAVHVASPRGMAATMAGLVVPMTVGRPASLPEGAGARRKSFVGVQSASGLG
jgi:hypothetical protein